MLHSICLQLRYKAWRGGGRNGGGESGRCGKGRSIAGRSWRSSSLRSAISFMIRVVSCASSIKNLLVSSGKFFHSRACKKPTLAKTFLSSGSMRLTPSSNVLQDSNTDGSAASSPAISKLLTMKAEIHSLKSFIRYLSAHTYTSILSEYASDQVRKSSCDIRPSITGSSKTT
jgi:hypothetical protein